MGDIRTARIVIEDGAYFKGNIDIVRAEAPKPAAAQPKPQAGDFGRHSPVAASASAGTSSGGATEIKR